MFAQAPPVYRSSSSAAIRPAPSVLRRCCGGGSGECEACRKKRLQRQPANSSTLRREETAKQPSNEEKMKEAAKKAGEAFLETGVGKDIKKQAEDLGKDFVSGLGGKIITGSAAAGVVTYLIAKNAELPVGIPDIPLDVVRPGLKLGITYEGPVRSPSKAMLTFTFSPGTPASKSKAPSEKDKFRAETARMARELSDFREGMKSPDQKAAEDEAFQRAYWGGMNKYGLRPLAIPGLEQKEEEGPVRREATNAATMGGSKAPPIVSDVLSDSGTPLPSGVQQHLESRFGHDFSRVRIHTGTRAAGSAMAVDARAYTVGSRIVFGSGQFSPTSGDGLRLLAHELAHVVQNESSHAGTTGELTIGSIDDPLEREADAAATQVLAGTAPTSGGHRTAGGAPYGRALKSHPNGVIRRVVPTPKRNDETSREARKRIDDAKKLLEGDTLDAEAKAELQSRIKAAERALDRYRSAPSGGGPFGLGSVQTQGVGPQAVAALILGLAAALILTSGSRTNEDNRAAAEALARALQDLVKPLPFVPEKTYDDPTDTIVDAPPVPTTPPAPKDKDVEKPDPKPENRPKPNEPRKPPRPVDPEADRRARCRGVCLPTHRGGNETHNTVCDNVSGNQCSGDFFLNGKNFDGLSGNPRTVWECKMGDFQRNAPFIQEQDAKRIAAEARTEQALARECKYNYILVVRDKIAYDYLDRLGLTKTVKVVHTSGR